MTRWDAKTGGRLEQTAMKKDVFSNHPNQFIFSSNGRLAVIERFETIDLWGLEPDQFKAQISGGPSDHIWNPKFSSDLRFMVCEWDHEPTIFDLSKLHEP